MTSLLIEAGHFDSSIVLQTGHTSVDTLKRYHNLQDEKGLKQQSALFGIAEFGKTENNNCDETRPSEFHSFPGLHRSQKNFDATINRTPISDNDTVSPRVAPTTSHNATQTSVGSINYSGTVNLTINHYHSQMANFKIQYNKVFEYSPLSPLHIMKEVN